MRNTAEVDEVFLATTALEEFWDITKPIVFLGDWCLLYERRSHWEALDGKVLSSSYRNSDDAENAYNYINGIYEQLVPVIGSALNSVHGKNYSVRYWRILIGPWLQSYLSATYDRFVHIKHALEQYPNLTTIGLSEESFVVPTDTLDFACLLSEDSYNLQLYTRILSHFSREFPKKGAQIPRSALYEKLASNSRVTNAIGQAVKFIAGVGEKFYKTAFIRNSYFSKKVELQLVAMNFGRVLLSWNQLQKSQNFECDSFKRDGLRGVDVGDGCFEQCISMLLYFDMPQCFVEGLLPLQETAHEQFSVSPSVIFSANGWYYDEPFKHWAAISAGKGTLLLGTQHGGNYGALSNMPSENHETAIVDYYYSWGWGKTNCNAKVIPMPATKLTGRKVVGADNRKNGVLWVATTSPRYVAQLPFLPKNFQEYLTWQMRFANALPQGVRANTRFRSHYESYGWGVAERMKNCAPDIQLESWEVSFQISLRNCRLYVCDHLSTTFSEALAVNKPTVLFWNTGTNKLRPEAQPYFDVLRAGGILFDTPELAASAVAAVYDDVETWWNSSERQEAVQIFCEQFSRTSRAAIALWGNELRRVSELSSM